MKFSEFSYVYTVKESDIDVNNHMNNVAYLNLINDVSAAHWDGMVTPEVSEKYFWIVRRHEIDYLGSCFLGDKIKVKTWVDEPKGATWKRFFSIETLKDGKIILEAQTTWVLINKLNQRPSRVTDEVIGVFLLK